MVVLVGMHSWRALSVALADQARQNCACHELQDNYDYQHDKLSMYKVRACAYRIILVLCRACLAGMAVAS